MKISPPRTLFKTVAMTFVMTVALGMGAQARAQNATVAAAGVTATPTLHCIGIEWPITGDANHNATCQVQYRSQGDTAWKNALPLLRCDNTPYRASGGHNGFYGSIFFLDPGTTYEVQLTIADPDGGATTKTLSVKTRSEPVQPTGGRTFHVVPGTGGGDGSAGNPFRGVAAAEAVAQAGDIFLLHAGDYGVVHLTRSGASNNWIVWKAAGDGNAIIRGMTVRNWVWLDGLYFLTEPGAPVIQNDHYITYGIVTGLTTNATVSASNVCVTWCTFREFTYSIALTASSNNWHITDNDIRGNNHPVTGGYGGEGIELKKTDGHVVAYNRISHVGDGVSYARKNCDIYGNEIIDVSDDGVETDHGQVNVRVWGNRITRPANNVFTFQPMGSGPWYFIRNQVIVTGFWVWKFVQTVDDRFLAVHNTFIFPECATKNAYGLLNSFSRNNLYIAHDTTNPRKLPLVRGAWDSQGPGGAGTGITSMPFWMTDVDYDGFDWNIKTNAFEWAGKTYADLASFSAAVGIQQNGIRVDRREIFANWATPTTVIGAPPVHMFLKAGSNAVDAGVVLPNINEDFAGAAPDLGALELGKPLPHYGPRIPSGPVIPQPPPSQTAVAGASVTFAVVAGGLPSPTYQWQKDGVDIAGATNDTLSLAGVQFSDAGGYTVVATNASGSVTSTPAVLTVNPPVSGRLVNLSIRTGAGSDSQSLIVGFVTDGGSANSSLLLRAAGPALLAHGVTGVLSDPRLTVNDAVPAVIQTNDDWASPLAAMFTQVGAFPWTVGSKDAALVLDLAPSPYTAVVTGFASSTGIALAEIYDTNTAFDPAKPELVNVSARAQVGTGANIMIAGFVIGGDIPQRVLIRAVGPTLASHGVTGVLANPRLAVFEGSTPIADNDDWDVALSTTFSDAGAFPLNAASQDAALLVTLVPGVYTAQVSGVDDTTGVALVEIYAVP